MDSAYTMGLLLDRGLIDFGLVYGPVDHAKYEAIQLPFPDSFGVLMRRDSPLAEKEYIDSEDLLDKPLIVSAQERKEGWRVLQNVSEDPSKLNVVASYTLLYNGSLLVAEGLGYAVCFDRLINTQGTNLCFRPLQPAFEVRASMIWKKYQVFSRAALKFLEKMQGMPDFSD